LSPAAGDDMKVREALSIRKSVRAFLPKEISREQVERILDAARHAPSGVNTQPWQVAVVQGDKKLQLQAELESRFREGTAAVMDYQYYPPEWSGPYRQRRKACGLQLYSAMQIERDDKPGQIDQCFATGNVTGKDNVGGFAGLLDGATITNSFARGDVYASQSFAGGFAGYTMEGTIGYSFSTGTVNDNGIGPYGGFIGSGGDSSFYNNYWDGISSGIYSSYGQSLGEITVSQTYYMVREETFTNWDFNGSNDA